MSLKSTPLASGSGSSLPRKFIAVAVLIGVLPFLVLAVVSLRQSQVENQRQVDAAIAVIERRITDVFENVERVLREAIEATGGVCGEEAVGVLRDSAYQFAAIREVGIIRQYELACTSWGLLDPPKALKRGDLSLQGRGPVLYVIDEPATGLAARSLAMGIGLGDGDHVNALIYPEAVYRVLDGYSVDEINIGVVLGGNRLLAARYDGRYRQFPPEAKLADYFPEDGYLHTERSIADFPLKVVAALPEELKYQHLIPQFTLYLCGAIFVSISGIWLISRISNFFRSIPFQLHTALVRRQLRLAYQPVMDIESRRCVGMEALLRWDHPSAGMIEPDLFIPMAERTRVILPITEWIVGEVIKDSEELLAQRPGLYVAINLCQQHLVSEAFVDVIVQRFMQSKIRPNQVHFELTERTLGSDHRAAVCTVDRLRSAGFRIAIDDFGTGYSTLSSMRQLRVDYLKIEKVFVEAIGTCAVTAHLVDSIIDMAKKLNVETVAEGVESAEQARYLLKRGVKVGQGFYFSKPVPFDRLAKLVNQSTESAVAG